jgi:hypothetical protein
MDVRFWSVTFCLVRAQILKRLGTKSRVPVHASNAREVLPTRAGVVPERQHGPSPWEALPGCLRWLYPPPLPVSRQGEALLPIDTVFHRIGRFRHLDHSQKTN